MTLSITMTPTAEQLAGWAGALPVRIAHAIRKAHDLQNQLTIGHTAQHRLNADRFGPPQPASMGVLRSVTARLKRSVRATPARLTETGIESSIGTNVRYAAIHEFGGTTPAHKITAKNKKALKFTVGGNTIFRRSVNHPGSKIPARAPIRRGIEDRLPDYEAAIALAAVTEARKMREEMAT